MRTRQNKGVPQNNAGESCEINGAATTGKARNIKSKTNRRRHTWRELFSPSQPLMTGVHRRVHMQSSGPVVRSKPYCGLDYGPFELTSVH